MKTQIYPVSLLIVLCQCMLQTTCFMTNLFTGIDPNNAIRHRGYNTATRRESEPIIRFDTARRAVPDTSDSISSPISHLAKGVRAKKDSSDTSKSGGNKVFTFKRGYDSIYAVAEPRDVGFHVSLTYSTVASRRNPIKFDTVHEGLPDKSVYDVTSGIFESPVSGVYLVSFTLATQENKDVTASVYVRRRGRTSGEKRLSVVANGQNGTSQGSITGFVTMNHGDELYVKVDFPSRAEVFGNNLTSLSVYLVNKH